MKKFFNKIILVFSVLILSVFLLQQSVYSQEILSGKSVELRISSSETSKTFVKQVQQIMFGNFDQVSINASDDVSGIDFEVMKIWLEEILPFNFADENTVSESENKDLRNNRVIAKSINKSSGQILVPENFVILKADKSKVFAFMFSNGLKKLVMVGNLDFKSPDVILLKIPEYSPKKQHLLPIKISDMPYYKKRKLVIPLNPGSICVFIIT